MAVRLQQQARDEGKGAGHPVPPAGTYTRDGHSLPWGAWGSPEPNVATTTLGSIVLIVRKDCLPGNSACTWLWREREPWVEKEASPQGPYTGVREGGTPDQAPCTRHCGSQGSRDWPKVVVALKLDSNSPSNSLASLTEENLQKELYKI